MRETVLPGRWVGADMNVQPEESKSRDRNAQRGHDASPWLDVRFWLQIIVLVGGLLGIYFADQRADTQQLATLNAAASELSRQATKMEGQVTSIDGSVRSLTNTVTSVQKDIESLRRELETLTREKETLEAWTQNLNGKIARLEARAGIN